MNKCVLIVTPRSPFLGRGADELDRLSGIRWFIEQEYEVRVVTKTMQSDLPVVEQSKNELGISIKSVPYKFNSHTSLWKKIMWYTKRVFWPPYWDGAAYEYFDTEIQTIVAQEIALHKPDLVWFDYTYLWPLYSLIPHDIPIYTRSINFEPTHFLDEDGRYPWNYIRVVPKLVSEWIVSRRSKFVFAITPKEQKEYALLGTRSVTLPLRGLPVAGSMPARAINTSNEIHIGFTASTYSVDHNRKALQFILKEILPKLRQQGTRYVFHFTGSRLPDSIMSLLSADDMHEGFVPSMMDFWARIDIALVPSLFGAGMQQKVFEPLVLGVPTITSKRAMAGYDFGEKEVVFASSASDFVREIQKLSINSEKRKQLSEGSIHLSKKLFSKESVHDVLSSAYL